MRGWSLSVVEGDVVSFVTCLNQTNLYLPTFVIKQPTKHKPQVMEPIQSEKFARLRREKPSLISRLMRNWVEAGQGNEDRMEPVEVDGVKYVLRPVVSDAEHRAPDSHKN